MRNDPNGCRYSTDGACLRPARDHMFHPENGRNPLSWSGWQLAPGPSSPPLPTTWISSSAELDNTGFRMEIAMGDQYVTWPYMGCQGPSAGVYTASGSVEMNEQTCINDAGCTPPTAALPPPRCRS